MANKIESGALLTVKDTRSGSGSKGDWCFCKTEGNDKITLWADNHDFKCAVGDSIEVLDIKSVSVSNQKRVARTCQKHYYCLHHQRAKKRAY